MELAGSHGEHYLIPWWPLALAALGLVLALVAAFYIPRPAPAQRRSWVAVALALVPLFVSLAVFGGTLAALSIGLRIRVAQVLWPVLLAANVLVVSSGAASMTALLRGLPHASAPPRTKLHLSLAAAGAFLSSLFGGGHALLLAMHPLPELALDEHHEPVHVHLGHSLEVDLTAGAEAFRVRPIRMGSRAGEHTVTVRAPRFFLTLERPVRVRVARPIATRVFPIRTGDEWRWQVDTWSANRVIFGLIDPHGRSWTMALRVDAPQNGRRLHAWHAKLDGGVVPGEDVLLYGMDGELWIETAEGRSPLLAATGPHPTPLRSLSPGAPFTFSILPTPCASMTAATDLRPAAPTECHHDPASVANIEALIYSSSLTLGLFSYGGDIESRARFLDGSRGEGPAMPAE